MATIAHHPAPLRTDDEIVHDLQADGKRKPLFAVAALVAGLIGIFTAVYFSYRDVPAPDNPANARPHLVEPYR